MLKSLFALILTACLSVTTIPVKDPVPACLVEDIFARPLNQRGIVLLDWEGYLANPAVKLHVVPPTNAAYPVQVVLRTTEPRLHFDMPSRTDAQGSRKELRFTRPEKQPFHLTIFPDRDGKEEQHTLHVEMTDAQGRKQSSTLAVQVIDQDRDRPAEFTIHVDFSQDRTGFFQNATARETVAQAARDWASFLADMQLRPVPVGMEKTMIWGPDGFKTTSVVTNAKEYTGYLLYVYGIKGEELRSGGEPSQLGGFQVSKGQRVQLRRSGGVEMEVQGNYNTKGWLYSLPDAQWWQATNLGEVTNDFYSIVHHEMGHALIFNINQPRFKRNVRLESPRLKAYLGNNPLVDRTDHLPRTIDPASLRGAFGNEYHGKMPYGRWLITKTDLLCAEAIGYQLRETSAFQELTLQDSPLPQATTGQLYTATLQATGGIPWYHFAVVDGALPPGLTLDSFTGELKGTPTTAGTYAFTVKVRDNSPHGAGVVQKCRVEVVQKASVGP